MKGMIKTVKIGDNQYEFIEVCNEQSTYDVINDLLFGDSKQFIAITKSITEEVASSVVEQSNWWLDRFYNYNIENNSSNQFKTALKSFYSLMDSLGLDRCKNYILVCIK